MWSEKRPEVVKAISVAAAEGDRSENAEYICRKKELRELDRKIRFLERQLKGVTVVHDKPENQDKVFFGATVTLLSLGNEKKQSVFRIVGPVEARSEMGEISFQSPMAKSLLGKMLDDEVVVPLPDGTNHVYIIVSIQY